MEKDTLDIEKITSDLKARFPNSGIESIEVDSTTGKSTFMLKPTKQNLAILKKPGMAIKPHVYNNRAQGSTIDRDYLSRQSLDLGHSTSPYEQDPKTLYKKADEYYYTEPIVGSVVNTLAALAMKGFENDTDDPNIKQFFDAWCFDVGFEEVLEWIFLDFFKIGHVTTYKVLAKYEPKVSFLGNDTKTNKKVKSELNRLSALHDRFEKERAATIDYVVKMASENGSYTAEDIKEIEKSAKKNIWSKGHLPVAYTVLNPQLVTIAGNLLFNKVSTSLTPPQELGEMLKKDQSLLTDEEKELIKALPSELKVAAEKGTDFQLDYRLVGSVTYRKQPYERYAKPRLTRVFDTLEYKRALKNADLSTLDGITNYILKITIGNDEYPVGSQEDLETVAQLFNNPNKSFDVVWNHTLSIEKIVSPEIDKILGSGKYSQVNDDMTGGLGIPRALIDGLGDSNVANVELATKGLMEEINYARRQVKRWIYREYQIIADAMGFEKFPKIRWDDSVLRDMILYMATISSLVDRRMLSYNTALEKLGFEYDNELKNMQEEMPLVEDGVFGILGSPWQQSAGNGIQPTQKSPTGTPSKGRPAGETKTKKKTNTDPINQPGSKPVKKQKSDINYELREMTDNQFRAFLEGAAEVLAGNDYRDFLETVSAIRFGDCE